MSTHFIGRDESGARYYVEIRLDEVNTLAKMTDHTADVLTHEFAASGFIIAKGARNAFAAGQMIQDLMFLQNLADGWTVGDVVSLVNIWRDWHLNGINAGSDEHKANGVTTVGEPDSTGYRYGSAWLARQLPGEVRDEIERLQSLPTGKVPSTY